MAAGKNKTRLDLLLVEKNYFSSRSRAAAEIMAGHVYINGVKTDKPGTPVRPGAKIEVRGKKNPYVSRGGLKLEKAIREFGLEQDGKTVLDIGASTGGFTHCALLHGALRVYALDVGYGQLDWELRNDPRVINMERKNIRYFKKEEIPETPDLAVVDVSFISLELVLPVLADLDIGEALCLVKPQFEASPAQVGKKGVVKSRPVHKAVLQNIIDMARGWLYILKDLTFSPVKGPQGNIEYLAYFLRTGGAEGEKTPGDEQILKLINTAVIQAHEELG